MLFRSRKDGHEYRASPGTFTNSATDVPNHGSFILEPDPPWDWRVSQNDNLWQGVAGINNPCPAGRSEERRGGKEGLRLCRARWAPEEEKKKRRKGEAGGRKGGREVEGGGERVEGWGWGGRGEGGRGGGRRREGAKESETALPSTLSSRAAQNNEGGTRLLISLNSEVS